MTCVSLIELFRINRQWRQRGADCRISKFILWLKNHSESQKIVVKGSLSETAFPVGYGIYGQFNG